MKRSMNLAVVLTALTLTFSDVMASDLKTRTENLENQMIELNQEIALLESDLAMDFIPVVAPYKSPATANKGCCNIGRAIGNVVREAGRGVNNVIRETSRGVNNVAREVSQAQQVWENIQREATKAYNDLRVLVDKIANVERWTESARLEIKKGGETVIQITGNIVRETGTAVVKIQVVTQQIHTYGTKGIELVLYSKISRSILPDDLIQAAQTGLEAFKLNNDIFVLAMNESMRLTKFPGYLHNKAYNLCMAESVYQDLGNYILLGKEEQKDRSQACFNASMVEFDKNELSPEDYELHKKRIAEMEAQAAKEKELLAQNQQAQTEKDQILAQKAEEQRKLQAKLDLLAKYQEELKRISDQATVIQNNTQDLIDDLTN